MILFSGRARGVGLIEARVMMEKLIVRLPQRPRLTLTANVICDVARAAVRLGAGRDIVVGGFLFFLATIDR